MVLLPGLGCDGRVFDPQRRAFPRIEVPAWIEPGRAESLAGYGRRMAATVDESPILGDATSKQVKDMYWYYLAQDLADKGGLGLWKQIAGVQQYAAQQEEQVNP